MATNVQHYDLRRVKELRLAFGAVLLVAAVMGVRSVLHFAVHGTWPSLVYAAIKLVLLATLGVLALKRSESTLALKVGGIGALISFLTDAAFLNRW
jgi:hypothetical protein